MMMCVCVCEKEEKYVVVYCMVLGVTSFTYEYVCGFYNCRQTMLAHSVHCYHHYQLSFFGQHSQFTLLLFSSNCCQFVCRSLFLSAMQLAIGRGEERGGGKWSSFLFFIILPAAISFNWVSFTLYVMSARVTMTLVTFFCQRDCWWFNFLLMPCRYGTTTCVCVCVPGYSVLFFCHTCM